MRTFRLWWTLCAAALLAMQAVQAPDRAGLGVRFT